MLIDSNQPAKFEIILFSTKLGVVESIGEQIFLPKSFLFILIDELLHFFNVSIKVGMTLASRKNTLSLMFFNDPKNLKYTLFILI